MKGKFFAPTNLLRLEETLKAHEPYSVINVSTTGLNNSECDEHSPTRVVLKQFEYDNEIKAYKETYSFDKMVQASEKAIEVAIATAQKGGYDAFAMGGIDVEAYKRGENVLSVEAFRKEFAEAIKIIREDNSLLIANGKEHVLSSLATIDCAKELTEYIAATSTANDKNGKVLDQIRLTQEYFQKNGINEKPSLENLRNALIPLPRNSFANDEKLWKDFKWQSKAEFLSLHKEVTERQYDINQRDKERRDNLMKEGIVGGDKRITIINNFITRHGIDEHILESEWRTMQRESEASYMQDMSERGKERYKNNSFHEKFGLLVEKGIVNPEKILQGDSEFHKLINLVEDPNNKGVVVIHAASTGFERGKPLPASTGFPIQFAAMAFTRENGKIDFSAKPQGIFDTIAAPSKSIATAERNINDPKRPYDTFKETGIDLVKYKAGEGVKSQDEAREHINAFFKAFPMQDYPIIAIGGTNGSEHSFAQVCMSNLGNFAMNTAPHVDITQAIKDYTFLVNHDESYPENVLFSEEKMEGKKFSLQDVAEARGKAPLNSTFMKCMFAAELIADLEKQQIELFRPEEKRQIKTYSQASLIEKLDSLEIGTPLKIRTSSKADFSQCVLIDKHDSGFSFAEEGNLFGFTKDFLNKKAEIMAVFDDNEPEKITAILDKHPKDIFPAKNSGDVKYEEDTKTVPAEEEEDERLEREAEKLFRRSAVPEFPYKKDDTPSIATASGVQKPVETFASRLSESRLNEARTEESGAKSDPSKRRIIEKPRVFTPRPDPLQAEPSSTPAKNDTSELVKIIAQQSQIIVQQSQTIAQQSVAITSQNEKLLAFLQEQNQLLRTVIELTQPTKTQELIKNADKETTITYMESLKEKISDLSDNLSFQAGSHLAKANESITDAQKIVEMGDIGKDDKNKNRTA